MHILLPRWQNLPLPQQIAQMIVVRASGYLFDHQIQYPMWEPPAHLLHHWVHTLGVGGVIVLGGSAVELGMRSHQLQDWATIPLFIAADIEEGVGQRFSGATWFPPPMALSAIAQQNMNLALHYAEQMGAVTAQEALAIGINWVLAPVVDVNNNPHNPVINVRAFAETPEQVSQLTTAFIRGTQAYPVLTTAKHFPGHGDTAVDSHLELPVLPHDLDRLWETELAPFQAAIASGADAVMTAHLHIPTLDPTYPATLSRSTLTGLLRQQLGFDGLIVTDALVMGAIANSYGVNEAPVMAVEAGADIVLMPADPEGAIAAIVDAVTCGRIPLEQIHASLERIWRAKYKICTLEAEGSTSHAWETVLPPPVQLEQLSTPAAIATRDAILNESLRVHLPSPAPAVRPSDTAPVNLLVLDDLLISPFLNRQAPAIALPQTYGYRCQIVDQHSPCSPNALTEPIPPTVLQLFIRGNPFRGSAAITELASAWLTRLVDANQLLGLVIYGSPYALQAFEPMIPDTVPYVFSYGQMPAAQAIALTRLFSHAAFGSMGAGTGDREFTT